MITLLAISGSGFADVAVHFLIFVLIICVCGALFSWALSNIPGIPGWAPRLVWAIVAIIILIAVLRTWAAFF